MMTPNAMQPAPVLRMVLYTLSIFIAFLPGNIIMPGLHTAHSMRRWRPLSDRR